MLYIWHSQSIAFWTCSCMWPTLWMLFCSFLRILYLPAHEFTMILMLLAFAELRPEAQHSMGKAQAHLIANARAELAL